MQLAKVTKNTSRRTEKRSSKGVTPQLGLTLQVQVGGHNGSELLQRLHGTAGVPGQVDKFCRRHITAN